MKISVKTVIALLATTLCLLLILNFVSDSVIQTNFSNIEQSQVTQTIATTQAAIINMVSALDSELVTWSQLNSTYEFMQNQNIEYYQQTYLTASSLSNLGVNFVIFLNQNGNFVTGEGLNTTTMQPMQIPQDIITLMSNNGLIWNLKSVGSDTRGFIMSEEGPLMLASRPILMANGAGPIAGPAMGTLIFATYYNSNEIKKLTYVMNLPMSIETIGSWETENNIHNSTLSASYIRPVNQQYINGYDIIDDINGQPILAVGATMPRTVYDQGLATISYIDQVLLVAGIIFSAIIVLFLEFSVLRRLSKLTNVASKLGKPENLSQKLPVSGNDEITWLTLSFNGLLQEIQRQSLKLQESERMSAIGELARQVGHDLRNPLTSTKYAAYYLRQKGDKCSDEDREKMLNIIEGDIRRSDKIINDLMEFSSEMCLEVEKCSPKSLLKGALSRSQVPENISLKNHALETPTMLADACKIERVFTIIIKNAVEAMPKGGTLEIQSTQKDSDVQITFADTGEGISPELLPKIFSPLLTTKAQGMGISLAICKRIVDNHGGKIEVESTVSVGTTFKITLPIKPQIHQQDQRKLMSKPDPLLHYKNSAVITLNGSSNLNNK